MSFIFVSFQKIEAWKEFKMKHWYHRSDFCLFLKTEKSHSEKEKRISILGTVIEMIRGNADMKAVCGNVVGHENLHQG